MRSAVVTLAAGRHEHLRRQHAHLAAAPHRPDDYVVVAMGDPDLESALDPSLDLRARVVHVPAQAAALPLAAARNAGVRAAVENGADLLVLLDVDCLPAPDLLRHYTAASTDRAGADALLCGPVTYLPPAPAAGWSPTALLAARNPHPARPAPPPGAVQPGDHELFWSLSFAVRTEVWTRIGGFFEGYTGYGGEDTDFAQQARARGVPLLWVGGAEAYHQHHATTAPPVQHLEDILRNGAVFFERWGWWPMAGWLEQFEQAGLARRVGDGWAPARPVRVAAIPPRHPYVDAVRPTTVAQVLPDRVSGWEPDPLLEPGALLAAAPGIEVVHLHFGYEHLDEAGLSAWADALRASRLPLVLTVHDLRNPHDPSREQHDGHLRVLIARAAEVLTLTQGAAAEIGDRFGRNATVVAHPTTLTAPPTPLPETERGLVTLHLKSLRRNVVDPAAVVAAAAEGAMRAGGRLRVDMHPEVVRRAELQPVHRLAKSGRIELNVHERFDDDELHDYLARSHVSVLPYRFGTHSGWLELCRDLGTAVVAPSSGHYLDQWADAVAYRHDEQSGLDPSSLAASVEQQLRAPPPRPAERRSRLAHREAVRARHAVLYAASRRR